MKKICFLLAIACALLLLGTSQVYAHGYSITVSPGHIHIWKEKSYTFTVADMDTGAGKAGLSPIIKYQHTSDESASEDSLADGDIVDNGDGTYTWKKNLTKYGSYVITFQFEQEGMTSFQSFVWETTRAGGERYFKPSKDNPQYAYQIRWNTDAGHIHAGDTVTFDIEFMRSFGSVNTERPWTNTFDHLSWMKGDLTGGKVEIVREDLAVIDDITASAQYLGKGIYRFTRTFPEDELSPGERKKYYLHVVITDELGYTLDNAIDDVASIEEFAITASRHGSSTSAVSFSAVLSIFQANCTVCHSGSSPSAGLDLSSYAGVMSGGNNGAVVVAGDAANSRLVQALEGTLTGVSRMPLGGSPLSESDIHNVIEAWINQGASSS